ncbi:MAG TPA: hypothetical protein VK071_09090 [Tissierellales bacterium]|nr:hypothetical protein [Tissierellales bacterium]
MAPLTAIPLIIGAGMLGKNEINKKGIMVDEEAIEDAEKFVKETVRRIRNDGFKFTINEELTVRKNIKYINKICQNYGPLGLMILALSLFLF